MQGMLFSTVKSKKRKPKLARKEKASESKKVPSVLGGLALDAVHLMDCVEGMKMLPTDSVDVAIADPPYNLSKGGNWQWDNSVQLPGFGGNWSKVMAEWDSMPLAEYLSFTIAWLAEVKRVVRPTGSLWVHGTYHNIGLINFALQLLEVEMINEVVWYKRNSFPNLSGRRLTASHETIIWAHTGTQKSRKYHFAYDSSKEMECPEDNLKEAGKQMRTVWDIPNNKKKDEISEGKHPTQKPLRLLHRMLEISAIEGATVLVPFAGAGSECIAAKRLGHQFIAFETDAEYVAICKKRLAQEGYEQEETHVSVPEPTETTVEPPKKTPAVRSVPSLIKWTGSKRSQAHAIAKLLPSYKRYFEPFLGGGAVLYLAGTKSAVVGDIYQPLISLWKLVRDAPDQVVKDYESKWKLLTEELDGLDKTSLKKRELAPKIYYKIRERFNETHDPLDLNFLMRTCVNGIVRFNESGEFNNSFHLSRRGMIPKRFENTVQAWNKALKNVELFCQDYQETVAMADKDDFVYFDPPYAGNRQRYIENLDIERFFATLEGLNQRRVKWALSFDGRRGDSDLTYEIPPSLYKQQIYLASGNSAVNKVLNGPIEMVEESLYLNY